MNFEHTENRKMLSDSLGRFIAERYGFAIREKAAASKEGFSPALWSELVDLGIVAAFFSESEGGFGGAGFDISVVFENIGHGLVVEPFLGALQVGRALALEGNAAQRERIAELIDGSTIAAFAHDEPDTHYEESLVRTTAQRDGEYWVLDGSKAVVQQGEKAGLFLVSARVAGDDAESAGLALFLIDADSPGVTLQGYQKIDGGRAAELHLHGVRVSPDALVGKAGAAHTLIERVTGYSVLALCAEAVGIMDVIRQSTVEYLQTRKQFGVPIGSFQALQHDMADLLLNVEQARSAVINASSAIDNEDRWSRERALSAAKYTIGHFGALIAESAIQLHGGIGMTWELPLSHYAKRLVMIDHQFGDEDHHLQRYIELGRNEGVAGISA